MGLILGRPKLKAGSPPKDLGYAWHLVNVSATPAPTDPLPPLALLPAVCLVLQDQEKRLKALEKPFETGCWNCQDMASGTCWNCGRTIT